MSSNLGGSREDKFTKLIPAQSNVVSTRLLLAAHSSTAALIGNFKD
jgi:hypothetical protein